jgi:hypothetical protein
VNNSHTQVFIKFVSIQQIQIQNKLVLILISKDMKKITLHLVKLNIYLLYNILLESMTTIEKKLINSHRELIRVYRNQHFQSDRENEHEISN